MKNYPLRLAILYFFMASLWIFLSDYVVQLLVPEHYVTTAQSIKGFGFIVVTALGLFFIVRHYYKLIRRNESEYSKLFQENPHPMWVYDTETLKFLTVNDAAVEKYKYTKEEFRNMDITKIRPAEDQDSILFFIRKIESKVYNDAGIWRHSDKDGKIFFVRITSHRTDFGNANARVVTAMDVTEQIEAQRKIQLSETKLKGLINNSDDLIWMVDNTGVIVAANDAFQKKFEQTFGFTPDMTKRMTLSDVSESFIASWTKYIQQGFNGHSCRVQEQITTPENKIQWFDIIVNPIYNDYNDIIGVGGFARDITHLKEVERQAKEQINQLKEVAWIQSHELRKPLANILGILSLLRNDQLPAEEQQKLLEHMEQSCNDLDTVVKKIVVKSATTNSGSET